MANVLVPKSGNLGFKMDTGELKGSKAVYKTCSLGNITGEANADKLAAIAAAFTPVLPWSVDEITLRRNYILSVE